MDGRAYVYVATSSASVSTNTYTSTTTTTTAMSSNTPMYMISVGRSTMASGGGVPRPQRYRLPLEPPPTYRAPAAPPLVSERRYVRAPAQRFAHRA